jgi:hypothetical protein
LVAGATGHGARAAGQMQRESSARGFRCVGRCRCARAACWAMCGDAMRTRYRLSPLAPPARAHLDLLSCSPHPAPLCFLASLTVFNNLVEPVCPQVQAVCLTRPCDRRPPSKQAQACRCKAALQYVTSYHHRRNLEYDSAAPGPQPSLLDVGCCNTVWLCCLDPQECRDWFLRLQRFLCLLFSRRFCRQR